MMPSTLDSYSYVIYPDFLNHLHIIETQISAIGINFNPNLTLEDIKQETSLTVKTVWCLYRISCLLKEAIKGPTVYRQAWLKKTGFFIRLYQSQTELEECLVLMTCMSSDQYYFPINTDEDFLLGCIFWELLQTLNPKFCSEANDFWENLYYSSVAWQYAFQYAPQFLYSHLLMYINAQEPNARERLQEKISNFNFKQYISNTSFIEINAKIKQINKFASSKFELPVFNDHYKAYEARAQVLNFLKSQLYHGYSLEASLLTKALNAYGWETVIGVFESAITLPNTYSYLKPEDKLRLVYDAIVYDPSKNDSQNLISSIANYGLSFIPKASNAVKWAVNSYTPGESFIRQYQPEYRLTELNETMFRELSSPVSIKNYYLEYGGTLLKELTERLNEEKALIDSIEILKQQISHYQNAREQFMAQFVMFDQNLNQRLYRIETYTDCDTLAGQHQDHQQTYDALFNNIMQLKDVIASIHVSDKLKIRNFNFFPIDKELRELKRCYKEIGLENEELNCIHTDFKEIMQTLLSLEQAHIKQCAAFSFPPPNPEKFKLPFVSILALLLASTGIAISIALLSGYSGFALLAVPMLEQYIMPLCLVLCGVSTGVAIQASMNLLRYTFFSMQKTSQLDVSKECIFTPVMEQVL